jgi:hypothetical protein
MCLFLCANLTAQQLLQPTIDRSWRRSLNLCVWHADDPPEGSVLMSNRPAASLRVSERPAAPNRGNSIAVPPIAAQEWSTSSDESAELRDQATNALAEAWGRLRRWFRGRL